VRGGVPGLAASPGGRYGPGEAHHDRVCRRRSPGGPHEESQEQGVSAPIVCLIY